MPPALRSTTLTRPTKCTPPWSKLYQPAPWLPLAVALAVGGAVVDQHVVLARDVERLQPRLADELVGQVELLGLGQVADVAGVQHEGRRAAAGRGSCAIAALSVPGTSVLASLLKPIWLSLIWTKLRPAGSAACASSIRSERGTPPAIVQTTPVPTQAMHCSRPRRSMFCTHDALRWRDV